MDSKYIEESSKGKGVPTFLVCMDNPTIFENLL